MGEKRTSSNFVVNEPEGKVSLARSRNRSKIEIKMDLKDVIQASLHFFHLAKCSGKLRALVNTIMNCRFRNMRGMFRVAVKC